MTDFPDRVYVTLTPDDGGAEELRVAFAAEDCDEGPIAIYELKSLGRNETRFVEGENKTGRREARPIRARMLGEA